MEYNNITCDSNCDVVGCKHNVLHNRGVLKTLMSKRFKYKFQMRTHHYVFLSVK